MNPAMIKAGVVTLQPDLETSKGNRGRFYLKSYLYGVIYANPSNVTILAPNLICITVFLLLVMSMCNLE